MRKTKVKLFHTESQQPGLEKVQLLHSAPTKTSTPGLICLKLRLTFDAQIPMDAYVRRKP